MAKWINIAAITYQAVNEEKPEQARERAYEQFRAVAGQLDGSGVDLVVTCECMEGLCQPKAEDAEALDKPGRMLTMYSDFAKRNRCVVAGSSKIKEDGHVYNALIFFGPDGGVLGTYRKHFLFRPEIDEGVMCGREASVIETPVGRLGGFICFDANFPDLRDHYAQSGVDILCFSSGFHAGGLQLRWAVDCQAFLAAATSGKAGKGRILDPLGRTLAEAHSRFAWARVNLDRFCFHLDFHLDAMADIRRKYGCEVAIETDWEMNRAVLYSLSRFSAFDVAREFGMTDCRNYLAGGRADREQLLRRAGR